MTSRVSTTLFAGLVLVAGAAEAAELPVIKAGNGNAVPACVTPGRLLAFLKSRNPDLDGRFERIASAYMRHGEQLQIRWDYAFYQMIVETGGLSFKRGNGRSGDVKPAQNNFAGLGATGGGVPGESFPDIDTGVKAHLQHVLLYAGEPVDDPVAERTRKVRDWGILTSWQKSLKRPVTYRDLARKWTSGDNGYANDIASVASRFMDDRCSQPDPQPELLAELRGGAPAKAALPTAAELPKVSGADLARQAVERARNEGAERSALGATSIAKAGAAAAVAAAQPPSSALPYKLLNAPPADAQAVQEPAGPATAASQSPPATVQNVAAASTLKPPAASPAATPGKCRVWTASYGGQKAIVIRSVTDQVTNYTVLDVNEGAEKREADAYIAAYAKGGQTVAEFASQALALDKAFDLCPEG